MRTLSEQIVSSGARAGLKEGFTPTCHTNGAGRGEDRELRDRVKATVSYASFSFDWTVARYTLATLCAAPRPLRKDL